MTAGTAADPYVAGVRVGTLGGLTLFGWGAFPAGSVTSSARPPRLTEPPPAGRVVVPGVVAWGLG